MPAMRLFLICAVACAVISARAQDVIPTKVNDQNRTGGLPFSTSIGTDVESVDVAGDNLRVHIPIVSIPGRGMNSGLVLTYDGRFWLASRYVDIHGNYIYQWKFESRGAAALSSAIGWRKNVGYFTHGTKKFSCLNNTATYLTNYIYIDPDGGKHPLAVQGAASSACAVQDANGPDLGGEGMWGMMPAEEEGQQPRVGESA